MVKASTELRDLQTQDLGPWKTQGTGELDPHCIWGNDAVPSEGSSDRTDGVSLGIKQKGSNFSLFGWVGC